MRSIANVFGRSPFVPLQTHMAKVADCVRRLPEILDAYERGEAERVAELRDMLSELLAHEDQLSYGDFFMWTRIIRQLSQIADRAENLAVSVRTVLENK